MKHLAQLFIPVLLIAASLAGLSFKGSGDITLHPDIKELPIGAKLPNGNVTLYHQWGYSVTGTLDSLTKDQHVLIAFAPTLSDESEFAEIFASSFDIYFAEGMAIQTSGYTPWGIMDGFQVIVVTQDDSATATSIMAEKDYNFSLVIDEDNKFASKFGVVDYIGNNDNAIALFYDINGDLIYKDYAFRAEGEKLKTLVAEVRESFSIDESPELKNYMPLFEGEKARDFTFSYLDKSKLKDYPAEEETEEIEQVNTEEINEDEPMKLRPDMHYGYGVPMENIDDYLTEMKLSDFEGKKNVLLAFYPAPYSFGCAMEVQTLETFIQDKMVEDLNNEEETDLEILMVSTTNPYITNTWGAEMELNNLKLISDTYHDISAKYSSYDNIFGYNKRTIFLIDKEGVVQYIDWSYIVNEEEFALLKDEIAKLP